jgi:hypothetical protein
LAVLDAHLRQQQRRLTAMRTALPPTMHMRDRQMQACSGRPLPPLLSKRM